MTRHNRPRVDRRCPSARGPPGYGNARASPQPRRGLTWSAEALRESFTNELRSLGTPSFKHQVHLRTERIEGKRLSE